MENDNGPGNEVPEWVLTTVFMLVTLLPVFSLCHGWLLPIGFLHSIWIRTYPFAKLPCRSLSGASHRSLHFHSVGYPVSVETPSNSLTNCLDNSSIKLGSTLSACILISWLNPYYGSLFNQILLTCVWSLCIPMVELDQYFGLSKVSLQRFWHLLNICKWIHHRSLWLDVTFAPLVPGLQPFTWLGASNVCTPL